MYSSRLIINSALLPENTKTPLNEFRDDYYRGTTLVIALPICMGQLLAIALSRLLTGAPRRDCPRTPKSAFRRSVFRILAAITNVSVTESVL
jgi:hypothetical protein